MSAITTSTPHDTTPPEARESKREPSLYARYTGAMLYFMGAALIAGGVVHYPLDPPVYTVICAVGAVVFVLGTVVNEFVLAAERPALRRALALVTSSLFLSFGVGMVGGGIQHFEAFPDRSAAMTPIGLLISYAAFVAKDPQGRWRDMFSRFGAGIIVVAALTWFGMNALVDSMTTDGHDHNHNQPAQEAPAPHNTAPTGTPTAPDQPTVAPTEMPTRATTGAHEHDSHDH